MTTNAKDRDVLFHEKWLGLAQPIEGLVFSVPALADAQIAPEERADLSVAFAAQLDDEGRLRSVAGFFREFLGYAEPGMLVPREALPAELSFYAAEGGQEIRPSFALGRGPFVAEDPFAAFAPGDHGVGPLAGARGTEAAGDRVVGPLAGARGTEATGAVQPAAPAAGPAASPYFALVWDLTATAPDLDLEAPEALTGPWRYPPTAKFERLLRHAGVPVGLLCNGRHLRLVYAPAGESTAHLTFRVEHLRGADGRALLTALDLLLHARRAYTAAPEHTLPGLLAESRRRQADVTEELAKQVFEAVEILLAGFEAAAARDGADDDAGWLGAALRAEGDHVYQGVLSVVLRLVFLLYAEDQALLPVEHRTYADHLSLGGLHARLGHDAGAHPESMHHRFGAYGQLLALFRAVFFGVTHGTLALPPRRGRLFDPNAYPFLEGGLPGWTAAVADPTARAEARPPSIDDGTIHRVLHRLVVFGGQRLSYRTLDVVQIGSIYESLMGYHVQRVASPALRLGKLGVWVETHALRALSAADRARFLKETCGLSAAAVQSIEKAAPADAPAKRAETGPSSPGRGSQGDEETGRSEDDLASPPPRLPVNSPSATRGAPGALSAGDAALLDALSAHTPGKRPDAFRHRAEPGRLVLQPGEERRRTGTHYTPPALTEKVVRRTLEPLLACLGEARTPEQILQLKICDPAMGSGAFLVAACRALAAEMVAAWTRRGELAAVLEEHGDAHLHARRLVAQRCLYGVDKNAAAVELAKLSLWLVTLSRTLPFTFVDHALRHGDSLVGLDFAQIGAFHWAPSGQTETCSVLLRDALDQAVELRQQILALADHEDVAAQADKRRLFDFSQQAIERVRLVADACVGAFFAEEKDAAREKERKRRLKLVEDWIGFERAALDESRAEELRARDMAVATVAYEELRVVADQAREKLAPFHWWIEFPEVFYLERPDPLDGDRRNGAAMMDAFVGNPPFMGKNTITESCGPHMLDWLMALRPEVRGKPNTDLCAYFFRRAADLLGQNGALGLVATNTIAQGDSRLMSLKALVDGGAKIYDAQASMPWPGKAAVVVSLVHMAFGRVVAMVPSSVLDGQEVAAIDSRLMPHPERAEAVPLARNGNMAFMGGKLVGAGLAVTIAERETLVAADAANAEVLRPYLGGEDINTSPTGAFARYVIDFTAKTLEQARRWPMLLRIAEEKVRPARENDKRGTYKTYWWRPGESGGALYAALGTQSKCLVTARVTRHLMFSFQPTNQFFNEKVYAFAFDGFAQFAVLQSRLHSCWTWLLSSTMKTDLNYSASDCFETFPFPQPDPRTVFPDLEAVGERLYNARAAYMVETNQGLTKTYNALKDPACADDRILALRRLHEEMDRAVLATYGWSEVAVPPYLPLTDADRAAAQAFEDEVIDRLYLLNAARAREEQRLGLGTKTRGRPAAAADPAAELDPEAPAPAKPGKAKKAPAKQGKLF